MAIRIRVTQQQRRRLEDHCDQLFNSDPEEWICNPGQHWSTWVQKEFGAKLTMYYSVDNTAVEYVLEFPDERSALMFSLKY